MTQPKPEGPTNEDLIQLAISTRLYRFQATAGDPIQYEMTEQQIHAFARAVLARFGRPASSLVERVSELRQKFEQLIKSSRAYDGYSTMTPVELADRLIDVVLELEADR